MSDYSNTEKHSKPLFYYLFAVFTRMDSIFSPDVEPPSSFFSFLGNHLYLLFVSGGFFQ
jgi:hypothetical protein